MNQQQTLFVTGISSAPENKGFDEITLLLSDIELNTLIARLASAMTQYHANEPPFRISVTLYGALQPGNQVKEISFVTKAN